MDYPGRVIQAGEADADLVRAIKARLCERLGPGMEEALDLGNGSFGPKMKRAVMLFQARNADRDGRTLKQDGQIGPLTWEALFDAGVPASPAPAAGSLLGEVLRVAEREAASDVRESPPYSNRGPQVERYLARVGLGGGHAWCCAFVYWCFDEAARQLGAANPMVRTAGCLDHWQRAGKAGASLVPAQAATNDPALVAPGAVFVMSHGGGLGHTGLVSACGGGFMSTIEGNTDAGGSREGGGVYRRRRKLGEVNKGFILYA